MTAEALRGQAPGQLRAAMVTALRESGYIHSPEVAAAFGRVPRELFAPGVPPSEVYAWREALVTRRDGSGRATSSLSAPWIQAQMIESASISRGDKILEIGSGGCNAGLLAEMTGPDGMVVTVDIDPWVTGRAADFLSAAGYGNVHVVLGDGETAADPYGPFDVIVVTVASWDCPWARLLRDGGRIVVPVIIATNTRSVTFTRHGDRWLGSDPAVCGFVAMQGAGVGHDRQADLGGGSVHLAVEGGPWLDQAALDRALAGPRSQAWTGVTALKAECYGTLNLWLATVDSGVGRIWQEPGRDLVRTPARWFTPVMVTPDSFAYLTCRPAGVDERVGLRRVEFGVHGHGPRGAALSERMTREILVWDRDRRHGPRPVFTLYAASSDVPAPVTGRIFSRRHTKIVMAWP